MSQERLAQLIYEQTTAIAALERQISTHEVMRRILRLLVLEEITLSQDAERLAERAELCDDPEPQALPQQTIAILRQMQAEEP